MEQEQDILQEYIDGLAPEGSVDLKALEAAAKARQSDPKSRANIEKGLFVARLLDQMDDLKMSQAELARKTGKTPQYISRILNENKQINFTIETMMELSMAVGLRLEIRTSPTATVTSAKPSTSASDNSAEGWYEHRARFVRSEIRPPRKIGA
jgi:transcriptional regulator with XRE-family HTH domain